MKEDCFVVDHENPGPNSNVPKLNWTMDMLSLLEKPQRIPA